MISIIIANVYLLCQYFLQKMLTFSVKCAILRFSCIATIKTMEACVMQKFKLEMFEKTEDGRFLKLPVLEIGIGNLKKSYPELFSTMISSPYTEKGRWFVNVPVAEASIAMDVLQFCGDPQRIQFNFV